MEDFFLQILIQRFKNPKASIALDSWVTLSTKLGVYSKVLKGVKLGDCEIGNYSYIGENCTFERTIMGSFCSIGPEVMCGMGTHPTNHVSTYPGFYSSKGANSYFFGTEHKVEEFKLVIIQSDVWIGARAIIVCGVEIGVGAISTPGKGLSARKNSPLVEYRNIGVSLEITVVLTN